MYRDLDENNKQQVRERVDMSMRSPTNNWINDSLQKIGGHKKSLSTERKIPPSNNFNSIAPVSNTSTNSVSDFNKIFKPQIKSTNSKAARPTKHSNSAASSSLTGVGGNNHHYSH